MPPSGIDKVSEIQRKMNDVLSKRIRLLEKEIKLAEKKGEIDEKAVRELQHVKKLQTDVNKSLEDGANVVKTLKDIYHKYAAAMTATALSIKTYQIATSSAEKAVKRHIRAATDLSVSYSDIGKLARSYTEVLKNDIKISKQYGVELKAVNEVSNKWIDTFRFIGPYSKAQREDVKKLTEQTIAYAGVLDMDFIKLQEKATDRVFKFGESGTEAMENLLYMRGAVNSVNKSLDTTGKTGNLFVEDFTKAVDEASAGTKGWTQDTKNLAAAMAWSAKRAFEAGESYDAATVAAKAMGKIITVGGGQESPIMHQVGLMLTRRIEAARGAGGELGADFLSRFTETQQASLKQLNYLMVNNKINPRLVNRMLVDMLSTSEEGIRATVGMLYELRASEGDISNILQEQLHLSDQEAIAMQYQLATAKDEEEVVRAIAKMRGDANKETEDAISNSEEGLKNLRRAQEGITTGFEWFDKYIREPVDSVVASIKAIFTDVQKVGIMAGVAIVLAVRRAVRGYAQFKSYAASIEMSTKRMSDYATKAAAAMGAGGGLTTRGMAGPGAAGVSTTAVQRGMGSALAPYSAGRALRVMDVSGRGGPGTPGKGAPGIVPGAAGGRGTPLVYAKGGAPTTTPGGLGGTAAGAAGVAGAGVAAAAAKRKITYQRPGGAPISTGGAAPTAPTVAKPGILSRLGKGGGMGGGIIASIATMIGADILINKLLGEPTDDEKWYKSITRTFGPLVASLGVPYLISAIAKLGVSAAGGIGAKLGLAGAAGVAKTAITGAGTLAAKVGGVAATAGAGTAMAVGGMLAAAAIPFYTLLSGEEGVNLTPDNALRYHKKTLKLNRPLEGGDFSRGAYADYVMRLADHPEWAEALKKEGIISGTFYEDVMSVIHTRAAALENPSAVMSGAMPSGLIVRAGRTASTDVQTPKGMKQISRGRFTDISAEKAKIDVTLEIDQPYLLVSKANAEAQRVGR